MPVKNIADFSEPNNGVQSDILGFYLHGAGGDGQSYLETIEANTPLYAGVTVVCPTSPFLDNDGKTYWPFNIMMKYYLRGMIDDLVENYGIDRNKIDGGGQSNGGAASYDLSDLYPTLFRGLAVSACFFPNDSSNIPNTVNVKHIHGNKDGTVEGQAGVPFDNVQENTFTKLEAGGANLSTIIVYNAGHSIAVSRDTLPTLNSKLYPDSVGQIMRRNIAV